MKIDPGLLGIWKECDSNNTDFLCVQSSTDFLNRFLKNYRSGEGYIDVQALFDKTVNEHKKNGDFLYYITGYGDKRGWYHEWKIFTSKINNEDFLNIGYLGGELNGFIFLRILHPNASPDSIIVATVADTALKHLNSSGEVRSYMEKNMYRPSFYKDTLHLYKVSDYHESLDKAYDHANYLR